MRHRTPLFLALTFVSSVAFSGVSMAHAAALTLYDALFLAYQGNPTLRGEQANQRAVTENSAQARSGWRPTVQLNLDASYQQGSYTGAFALGSYTSNFAEGYLSARQTLYSFGHVANQVRAADARSRAEQYQLRLVEAQVFTSAVTAYMNVLRDRDILNVRRADLDMLTRQVQLTTSRYNLGGQPSEQLTRTDVAQAETRQRSAEVAVTQARTALAASIAQFRAVIGTDPEDLIMPVSLPGLPATLDQALKTALTLNPRLIQMQETRKATSADIDTARSQWGPQIQVQGTFGTIGPASPFRGDQYGEEVTGLVQLVQPIYTGDLYNSQIRQARNRDEQAREGTELARRTALQDVATSWHAVKNGLEAIRAGMAEVRSGETSLKGYQIEYGYGLRSTTDVLYADQNLRSAQVELASSRHDTIVAEAALLAAIGRLQSEDLLPNLPHYDAAAKLQRARTRGWEPLQAPISAIDKADW